MNVKNTCVIRCSSLRFRPGHINEVDFRGKRFRGTINIGFIRSLISFKVFRCQISMLSILTEIRNTGSYIRLNPDEPKSSTSQSYLRAAQIDTSVSYKYLRRRQTTIYAASAGTSTPRVICLLPGGHSRWFIQSLWHCFG